MTNLTLVSGDKPEPKYANEINVKIAHARANDFADEMLKLGIHVLMTGADANPLKEGGVPCFRVGILDGASDRTCDALISAQFQNIREIVDLHPKIAQELDRVEKIIFASLKAGEI